MSALLTLAGVVGVRGGRTLFGPLDLTLASGAALAIDGPNGIGKTTLLRIAAGLLAPAAGTVVRVGAVGWLGEAAALDDTRSLGAALADWARADALPNPRQRVARGLAAIGLLKLAAVPIRFLSTGQRRRAALARVIASEAPLWLLDEPASGLDGASRGALEDAIDAHRGAGGAVVVVSHQSLVIPAAQRLMLS